MRDARFFLILAGASLGLAACGREEQPDDNQVITDINAADPGDIEAVPPDESVDPIANDAIGEADEANLAGANLG
jgi:hypothetical protein